MIVNYFSRRNRLPVCVLCLVTVLFLTGCEPLRKKFTRQKKKNITGTEEFIPVLEPEEYPVKQYGPQDAYAQHYSLCKIWFSDFIASSEESNEKKQKNSLDAALKEVEEMEKVLKSPGLEALDKIKKQIQFVRDQYNKPRSFRSSARIASEARDIDMTLRKKLKPEMLKESFKES